MRLVVDGMCLDVPDTPENGEELANPAPLRRFLNVTHGNGGS